MTNKVNIGASAEGSDGVYNGGISTTFAVPLAGQFTVQLSGSSSDEIDKRGDAVSLQHNLQLGNFSTNLLLRKYSRYYATIGNPLPTEDNTRHEIRAGMGFSLNPLGSFSVNYAQTENFKGMDTQVISLNYSRTLYRSISLFATGSATRATGEDTNYSGFIGLNFALMDNVRGSAQVNFGSDDVNSETLQVQKDIPVGEGLGYRASVNRSETAANTVYTTNPYVQYNARYGIYSFDAQIQDSKNGISTESYNLSAAGSMVWAGEYLGLSRPVSDSFGVVLFNKTFRVRQCSTTVRKSGKWVLSAQWLYPRCLPTVRIRLLSTRKIFRLILQYRMSTRTLSPFFVERFLYLFRCPAVARGYGDDLCEKRRKENSVGICRDRHEDR